MIKLKFLPLLFLLSFCGRETEPKLKNIHKVGFVNLKDVIIATGILNPTLQFDLRSESSGKIEKLFIKEGQRISRGDTILLIDAEQLKFRMEKLQLSVKRARIVKDKEERTYNRALMLNKTGSVSQKSLADLKSALQLAAIAHEQEVLELKEVQNQLEKTVLTSPCDGVILDIKVKYGEIVVSATSSYQNGTLIGTLADMSDLEVIADVGEADYTHLKLGQQVNISREAATDMSASGTIDFLALNAKRKRGQEIGSFEVRIGIDSIQPWMVPGVNLNVEFLLMEKKEVLGIPYALVPENSKTVNLTILRATTDGQTEQIESEVVVGDTDYKHFEIVSGLKLNDVIMGQN